MAHATSPAPFRSGHRVLTGNLRDSSARSVTEVDGSASTKPGPRTGPQKEDAGSQKGLEWCNQPEVPNHREQHASERHHQKAEGVGGAQHAGTPFGRRPDHLDRGEWNLEESGEERRDEEQRPEHPVAERSRPEIGGRQDAEQRERRAGRRAGQP